MTKRRTYKNKAEEEFCKYIEKQGMRPIKRGWPDFFCYDKKTSRFICVEVKPTKTHSLKKEQLLVCKHLAYHGIAVFRWDAEDKIMERINLKTERIRTPKPKSPTEYKKTAGRGEYTGNSLTG